MLALVTGASSGIGEATAKALAARGAKLILVARTEPELKRVAEQISSRGGAAAVFPVDLSREDAVAAMATRVVEQEGLPDIIVNNAGAGRWRSALETDPSEARRMMELPYLAAFSVTHAFLPGMLARHSGHIVNIASPASYLVWPNACAYIAARHALKGFTDALRTEVRAQGIVVSLVVLGTVDSPYWERNPGSRQHLPMKGPSLTTEQAADAVVTAIVRRRRRVVRPAWFRFIFALEGLFPGSTSRS